MCKLCFTDISYKEVILSNHLNSWGSISFCGLLAFYRFVEKKFCELILIIDFSICGGCKFV